ncbi:MAG: hypothetical protein J7M34_00675 [Anaerolineae bacterium]|nr:hypothetical protein [Anaerolineae bacterium]
MRRRRIGYHLHSGIPALADLGAEEIGERLKAAGCTGVFVHSPDPRLVDVLHVAGIEVYVSLGVFSGSGLWDRFPGSRPITTDGTPAPREEWYEPLIPTLPELRAHRLDELESLAQMARVDGLWLDAIRWPARWECPRPHLYHSSFDPVTLRQFEADAGIVLPVDPGAPAEAARWILDNVADAWFDWRCQQIVSFVAEARARLRKHLPDAILGAFTVPWTDEDFDQAFLRIVGQDPARMAPYVDVFSPMVYHRMCGRDVEWVGRVSRWVRERSGRTVWPIIEAVDSPDAYPTPEFAAACEEAARASDGTVMVFTLEGLLAVPERVDAWLSE